ncbi:wax ester/triacylglycerol synthase family O-acyltransferase [Salinibacterium sp. ZJ454]|uniref:wax ester/triacylglycerol synthase family O-acyltransferase n=1 Tax=Salinibacterium sp. ZJ454 TaxID=2708339 RepID=UPI001FBA032B|nr:wax ester/triacylglycerol synthase family O-acyltransferase [Salinibacterium sp. ZJ454]
MRPLLPRSSLNQPTGPRRRYASLRFSLQRIIAVAHQHDATVNDLLLAAITGALHTLLQSRGETLDHFVLSVPVSDRRETTIANLGNRNGVIPWPCPAPAIQHPDWN